MRDHRSAVLDVPMDASSAPEPRDRTPLVPLIPLVVRPVSSRPPGQGRPPGPALVGAASAKSNVAAMGGGTGSFFRACILLLLQEQPAHGYDILERLTWFGFNSGDSGWMYRTLRAYERESVVESTWQISASGPPRRVYHLTDDGLALLDAWAGSLRASKRGIDEFLVRHQRALGGRPIRD